MRKWTTFNVGVAVVALGCSASSSSKDMQNHDRTMNPQLATGGASTDNLGAGGGPSSNRSAGGASNLDRDAARPVDSGHLSKGAPDATNPTCKEVNCELVTPGKTGSLCDSDSACPPPLEAGLIDASDSDSGHDTFCVTAPWVNSPVQFAAADGRMSIPAGTYTLRYVGGAQIHDGSEGYEVTAHYVIGTIEAGHHLFNGASPETSVTSVWLDDAGTIGSQPTVTDVEQKNAGHTWSFQHAGGPLFITYYDDYYGDNQGPGTRLCIDVY
jgi:hypothetical protein